MFSAEDILIFGVCSFSCLQKANDPSSRVFLLSRNFGEKVKASHVTHFVEAIESGNLSQPHWL